MAVSEKCEKCAVSLEFPSAREVLEKKRTCPACGHSQRVEKSILYVVETLEEQVEWLNERLQVIEAQMGITARTKPQPAPPKRPVIHPPLGILDIPAAPSVDLFADVLPAPATNLPDII